MNTTNVKFLGVNIALNFGLWHILIYLETEISITNSMLSIQRQVSTIEFNRHCSKSGCVFDIRTLIFIGNTQPIIKNL